MLPPIPPLTNTHTHARLVGLSSSLLQIFSEPLAAEVTKVGGVSVTLWDMWDVHGHPAMTLMEFVEVFQVRLR